MVYKILHLAGIEPGSAAWQASIVPLRYGRSWDAAYEIALNTDEKREDASALCCLAMSRRLTEVRQFAALPYELLVSV